MKALRGQRPRRLSCLTAGFTLIEVVVASAILAVGLAGVLLICTNGLRAARILDKVHVDAGSVAAMLSLTNASRFEEGRDNGSFGEENPGYSWAREVYVARSNGLYQADFSVFSAADPRGMDSRLSIFLYRPGAVQRVGR
ncbi:MAG TPA: prepilin-type N-terminal cleavage/methylation domain-containing protein [Verrucomicrobiota bacterium]|nr:prepilin-type N-terminal cleavage/methylation domain-containing protein [Verrucomicrobiota bacterium]